MKKLFLSFTVILMSFFSANLLAQDVPGGSSDGGGGTPPDGGSTGVPAQPQAIHFVRNNGDGTCNGMAQIRLYYSTAPTVAPVLTEITYQNEPLYSNFSSVTGSLANFANTGYVSFCLTTSNIPPAIKLTLTYKPGGTNQPAEQISGTD